MFFVEVFIAILLAYLIGSISSAILVCKIMRLPDPRTQGSRNPGATNVLRIGGKLPAAITLLGDVLKGFIPVSFAKWYGFDTSILAFVAFAAFLGHLYPIYFRFEGGKGVATLLGILFALSYLTAIVWIITWLIIVLISRYVSLASLIATILSPLYIFYFTNDWCYLLLLIAITLLLIYTHRENIKKLLSGTENKLGERR